LRRHLSCFAPLLAVFQLLERQPKVLFSRLCVAGRRLRHGERVPAVRPVFGVITKECNGLAGKRQRAFGT
jgi:hypothetical protein